MQITIYRDESEFKTIGIDDRSREVKRFMSDDYVSLVFDLTEYIDFEIGDYISRNGINYKLNQLPKITKVSSVKYEYKAIFEAPMYDLINVIYRGIAGKVEHYFNGTIYDYLDLLLNNLDRVYGTDTWTKTVDVFYPDEYKNMHFNGTNCLSALQNICKKFDVRFKVENKNIIVKSKFGYVYTNKLQYDGADLKYKDQVLTLNGQYVADPIMTLNYGYDGNLYEITRTKVDSYNLFTRLYARGSYRNITKDYSSEGRLKTGTTDYLEKNTGTYGVIEKSAVFEDIYPSFEGNVSAIDNADEQIFYDNHINFDVNDYLISGVSAKVHFNTGDLAGYSFNIVDFVIGSGKFTIAQYRNEQEDVLPNSTLKPQVGDRYTILDISLPDEYVQDAENKLTEKAQEYLDKNSKPRVKYNVKLTPYFFQDQSEVIDIGDWVTVNDPQFGTKVVQIIKRSKTLIGRASHGFEMDLEISDTEAEEVNIKTVYSSQKVIGEQSELARRTNENQAKTNQSVEPYNKYIDKEGNEYLRVGDLNKLLDYDSTVYGLFVGDKTGYKITIDAINGIRFLDKNDNVLVKIKDELKSGWPGTRADRADGEGFGEYAASKFEIKGDVSNYENSMIVSSESYSGSYSGSFIYMAFSGRNSGDFTHGLPNNNNVDLASGSVYIDANGFLKVKF